MKSLTRAIPFLLAVTVASQVDQASPAQQPDWQPEKTWIVVVGVLEWETAALQKFPKDHRRDAELVEYFHERKVPNSQIVFLQDQQATKKRIVRTLAEMLPKSRENDLLIIYYAGHGTRHNGMAYFANYDVGQDWTETGWSISSIFDAIEQHFRGARVILAADCCHSGMLGVEAEKHKGRIAYSTLTSVHPNGVSTGHWTFTECLLKGLRGDSTMDANGDGRLVLEELARYTESELAFAEGQMASFTVANGFDPKLVVAITNGKRDSPPSKRFEVEWQGNWWPAHLLQVDGEKTKVHYAGFGSEWDEWVGPDRIRPYQPKPLAKGTAVEVEWNAKWYPASVSDWRSGLHYIHYRGFGPEWDEWVGPRRLRMTGGR